MNKDIELSSAEIGEDEQAHPLWKADRVILHSVGIDIGSSTSHLIFSALEMRRQSAALSSRFALADRRVIYASSVMLTPFVNGASLDVEKLSGFFSDAYGKAGLTASEIDTGAVITTGDAARKDNAAAVLSLFARDSGKFVCASAGPLLEAKMAAYGAGAVARSASGSAPSTIMNIDVGGGTSKIAVVQGGRIVETLAMNVGARLITFDENGILTKIERGAEIVAEQEGWKLEVGKPVSEEIRAALSEILADALLHVVSRRPHTKLTQDLLITGALTSKDKIDVVMFSGGVSEYVYGHQSQKFGDIGIHLANRLREQIATHVPGAVLEQPAQRIRATVIGASQFTAQLSGNTIYIGNHSLLPLRNMRVVKVEFAPADLSSAGISRKVREGLEQHEVMLAEMPAVIAFSWPHGPAYAQLKNLCDGLGDALRDAALHKMPIVLVIDTDLARLIGHNLQLARSGYENIVCIDGVELQDFDYIDVSEQHADSDVVTVVVKSLVFSG
ncbi:MAG: ethanolamine ammonia-lyase reactivating factor EutA [Pseudorhodoplanes sp.]